MADEARKRAKLVLEDGAVFEGTSFGAPGESVGEVVFNTSMTGYQEILTDPSYTGQLVCMTYPLIGNYGVNVEDVESPRPQVRGLIIRELSAIYSSFRGAENLSSYLARHGITGIEGIDTRALTKRIREGGAMRAVLSTEEMDTKALVAKANSAPSMEGADLVKVVTPSEPRPRMHVDSGGFFHNPFAQKGVSYHVVAVDCGMKANIVRLFSAAGCEVTAVPANMRADEVLEFEPDGIFVSNGPGDPAAVGYLVETLKTLVEKLPVFGICLGHQLLALAFGAETFKLKFGHHGANHPVMRLETRKVEITSQNHGFAVDVDTMEPAGLEVTHINLNDQTVEGFQHSELPVYSVQYHPEAAPGPHDSSYLFGRFLAAMKNRKAV